MQMPKFRVKFMGRSETAHHNNKNERRSTVYNELNITVSGLPGDQEAGSNGSVLGKLWATDEQDVLALVSINPSRVMYYDYTIWDAMVKAVL